MLGMIKSIAAPELLSLFLFLTPSFPAELQ